MKESCLWQIMRLLSKFLLAGFIIVLSGMNAWSADRTLTMYFMGTGIKSNISPWGDPELLSKTYGEDLSREIVRSNSSEGGIFDLSLPAGEGVLYKYISDGVGTTDGSYEDILGKGVPELAERGWDEIQNEALTALGLVLKESAETDTLTVNLLGFSRGGVSTIFTAHAISALKDDAGPSIPNIKINILAFDPVPGVIKPIEAYGADRFRLSGYVNQYVGVYADNERTWLFEPIIPNKTISTTKTLLLRLPGAHETLVGNLQYDGHAFALGAYPGSDAKLEWLTQPVSDMSRWLIEALLTSPEWGEVEFAYPVSLDRSMFDNTLSALNWAQCAVMQRFTFTPLLGGVNACYSKLNKDHQLSGGVPALADLSLYDNSHRMVIVAPSTFAGGLSWVPCGLFGWPILIYYPPIYTQVYELNSFVPRLNSSHWDTLQSFRGSTPSVDEMPPVADIDPLPDVFGECSVSVTSLNPPQATDNVDGTIMGTTTAPDSFDEQGEHLITWDYTDSNGNTSIQEQRVLVEDTAPPTPDSDDPETEEIAEGLPVVQASRLSRDNVPPRSP